jgi:NADPH2:quinone reductase
MQAVWMTRYGDPSVLEVREILDPDPSTGEVLVRVAYASITFIETLIRAGRGPGPGPQPPYVPGNGVGGTVVAVGPDVDPGWIGRRVVTGTGGTGGYAEFAVAGVTGLVGVPDGLDLDAATALLADGRTALGLVQAAAHRTGETALVLAAAGGVGSLLVQLVSPAVGAAGGPDKVAAAAALGAATTVDYRTPGWTAGLPTIDIVFDGVGGAIGAEALRALRPGGRFVQYGLAGGAPTTVDRDDITLIGFETLRAIGVRSTELTGEALALAASGRLRPTIGGRYPLAAAADAHRAIEARETIGKTLLIVE